MQSTITSYQEASEIATNLKTCAQNMEEIKNKLANLYGQVGSESVWSGNAAEAAKETFDKFIEKFPALINAINECSSTLNTVVANYQAADSTVTGQANM